MNGRWVEHNRNNSKSSILLVWVAWLAHVVASKPIFDVEVDIKDIVGLVVFNDRLKLFVLPAYLLIQVLRV